MYDGRLPNNFGVLDVLLITWLVVIAAGCRIILPNNFGLMPSLRQFSFMESSMQVVLVGCCALRLVAKSKIKRPAFVEIGPRRLKTFLETFSLKC